MRICPVCGAVAFDDALICYGCLHRFEEASSDEIDEEEALWQTTATVASARGGWHDGAAPEFFIRLTPSQDDGGVVTWACAVELGR